MTKPQSKKPQQQRQFAREMKEPAMPPGMEPPSDTSAMRGPGGQFVKRPAPMAALTDVRLNKSVALGSGAQQRPRPMALDTARDLAPPPLPDGEVDGLPRRQQRSPADQILVDDVAMNDITPEMRTAFLEWYAARSANLPIAGEVDVQPSTAFAEPYVGKAYTAGPYRMCFDINQPVQREVLALFEKSIALFIRKNTDYGTSFRKDVLDIPAFKANWVRATDKIRRIENILIGNEPRVKEETVEDTLMDLSVYPVLMLLCLRDHKSRPREALLADLERMRAAYVALEERLQTCP